MMVRTRAVLVNGWAVRAAELWGFTPAGRDVCPSVLVGRRCTRCGPPGRCLCCDRRWRFVAEGPEIVRLWRDSAGILVLTVDPYPWWDGHAPAPDDRWIGAARAWAVEHELMVELRSPAARRQEGGTSLHVRRAPRPRLVTVALPSSATPAELASA